MRGRLALRVHGVQHHRDAVLLHQTLQQTEVRVKVEVVPQLGEVVDAAVGGEEAGRVLADYWAVGPSVEDGRGAAEPQLPEEAAQTGPNEVGQTDYIEIALVGGTQQNATVDGLEEH